MGFLNHIEILRNSTVKYGLPLPQYTVYPDPKFKKKSFFLAQININEHFVIQAGPTSELAENRASSKLLLLLMRSYDLCDENFYNNDDKKTQKTKNQSVQTDPRPKLVPWENSVTLKCMLQKSAVHEIFRKLTNQPDFPLHIHPETLQHPADYFLRFSKKHLDLNPTTCKNPILSNINPTFIFQPSEKPNEFP